jgi:porin
MKPRNHATGKVGPNAHEARFSAPGGAKTILVASCFALWSAGYAAAFAQSATVSPSPSPAVAPTSNPSFGALGDLGGARQKWLDHGISLYGRYVGEFAANANGGFQQGSAYASEFQLGLDADLGKMSKSDLGILHFIFTERWGSGLSTNAIGNIGSVQEIFGDGLTPRLTELAFEQPLDRGRLNVVAGRVIMQNDFAASSQYWGTNLWCSYQTNAICGTPVAAPNNSGYGYYPSSEWGVRVKVLPSNSFYVESGVYQVNPVYAQRGQGFNLGFYGSTGVMIPLEAGVTFRDKGGNQRGDLRIGGYYDTSDVRTAEADIANFVPPTNPVVGVLPTTMYRGRSGGWLLADALLEGSAQAGKAGTALFASYEYGDPQTALISNFIDGRIVRHGTLRGRPNDTLSFGVDYIELNPRIRTLESSLQLAGYAVPLNVEETALELNYSAAFTNWLSIRPGLQYVFHPAGESYIVYPGGFVGLGGAMVYGLGLYASF